MRNFKRAVEGEEDMSKMMLRMVSLGSAEGRGGVGTDGESPDAV